MAKNLIRTEKDFYEKYAGGLEHALMRYLDPKNIAKGEIEDEEPINLIRGLIEETLEVELAHNHESLEREESELGDAILMCLARLRQIKKEKNGIHARTVS